MRIVVVSEFFYPYKTSTQKIMTELCEDFVEYGLDVQVLTTKNAYREEIQDVKKTEVYKGIKIKRILASGFNRDSKVGRLINYFTFILSVFFNLLFKRNYDKVLFVSNPPLVPYIGYLVNIIRGKKYYYLVHDVYPDVAERLGVVKEGSFAVRIMNYINNKIYKRAEKIIVLGKDMKNVIKNKGVSSEKIEIITNWADKNKNYKVKVSDEFREKNKLNNKMNIMYTGNISKVHAIDTLIEVARYFKNENEIQFTLVGNGNCKDYVENIKKEENLDNIVLRDYMFGEEYNNILNCADLFIVTLQEGIEGLGVPSKTYTYMSVGKPILAIMKGGSEVGDMITENNLGARFDKTEVDRIIGYIELIKGNEEMYMEQSENIEKLFNKYYERKVVTKKFFSLINM